MSAHHYYFPKVLAAITQGQDNIIGGGWVHLIFKIYNQQVDGLSYGANRCNVERPERQGKGQIITEKI